MKPLFCAYSKTLITLAAAVAATIGTITQAQPQPQPAPPNATTSALPADIMPGSPLAEVVKLLQAGVDASTIKSFILNAQSAFNLDTDQILFLKDAGAPSDLINMMMDRDKVLYAAAAVPSASPAPAPAPAPATGASDTGTPTTTDVAPPTTDMTLDSFNDTLAPYGSWVNVEGYGQCWRPTAVVYDSSWTPYCDRGSWVYTDYGWYWDSDYAWGVTFHYGRWFFNPQYGWCWCPDTVWAPSWVIWRSDDEYCGWAPLPPFTVFSPAGFLYRGALVGLDYNFGLGPDSFVFLSAAHLYDRHPRSFRVAHQRAAQLFSQTRVVNNYSVINHTIVNHGIGVARIASAAHRAIEPVQVSTLPNAGRQGWRGEGFERTMRPPGAFNNSGGFNNPGARNYTGQGFNSGANAGTPQFRRSTETFNNGFQNSPNSALPPARGNGTVANEGLLPRSEEQSPNHAFVPEGPQHSEASPRVVPNQAQPRYPVAVPPGGANGGNNNKQNQNH